MLFSIDAKAAFDERGIVTRPSGIDKGIPFPNWYIAHFDGKGYGLSIIERQIYEANGLSPESSPANAECSLSQTWITTAPPHEGSSWKKHRRVPRPYF